MTINKMIALAVCGAVFTTSLSAGVDSHKAVYRGGTITELDQNKEARLNVSGADELTFITSNYRLAVPFKSIQSIEYGQKAGRRVGAAIATAVLVSPVGLFLLFSKKRKHMVSLTWTNGEKTEAAVFEVGKDAVRTTLKVLEAKSGKETEYESSEARENLGK